MIISQCVIGAAEDRPKDLMLPYHLNDYSYEDDFYVQLVALGKCYYFDIAKKLVIFVVVVI